MPYLSKAPLSFAIQTPVAIGPIDEYAMVILVWASEVCEKTNVNTAGKLAIRHFNNGFILSPVTGCQSVSRNYQDHHQGSAPQRSFRYTWRTGTCSRAGRARACSCPAARGRGARLCGDKMRPCF